MRETRALESGDVNGAGGVVAVAGFGLSGRRDCAGEAGV